MYNWADAKNDSVCNGIIMNIKSKIEKEFTITAPKESAKNKRWNCTLPSTYSENGKRVQFRGQTKDEVIDKVAEYLVTKQKKKKITINTLYDEWLEWKSQIDNNCAETVKQYRSSYTKYIKDYSIADKPISQVTIDDIQDWCSEMLSKNHLTSKQFGIVKINIGGVFKYAIRKKIITYNPWKNGEFYFKCRSVQRKSTEEVIFSDTEIKDLFAELKRGYAENQNQANIALMLNFDLGLREGEIVALKWSDISFTNKTVMIHRSENSDKQVVDTVKSDSAAGYREIPLSDTAIKLLKDLRSESKIIPNQDSFVFLGLDGKRLTKIQYAHRLDKAELRCGFSRIKRTHCIRRTFASKLLASGVPETTVQVLLGHTTLTTTHKYCYDVLTKCEKHNAINDNSILNNLVV